MSTQRDEATMQDIDAVNRRIDDLDRRFSEAFPAGDHIGHYRYHALMIEQIEERRRLRRAVLEKSIAGLAWAVMLFIGLAVWNYVLSLIRRGS